MQKEIEKITELVVRFHKNNRKKISSNRVPVSGKVCDENESVNLVKAALEGWWTDGEWNRMFEGRLRTFLGMEFCLTVNSGSSANLVALRSLLSPKLGKKSIKPGDEVIAVAAAFPTTVNPIIEIGAIPVFLDVVPGKYNVSAPDIAEAVTKKTKAVFLAHCLGNPFEAEAVKKICDKYGLWFIEDNCDALGSKRCGKHTGTFGDISTLSFYPAHHVTTGEGGAVLTNNPLLYKVARSIRDWGRDCWCPTGKDNTCKNRFGWQMGKLPHGYDHKYIYSEIGGNFKMTDLQAAIGVAQMDKLDGFIKKRDENFQYLYGKLKEFKDYFILPEAAPGSEPCWFGFPLTIKGNRINRTGLLEYLNRMGVETRLIFAGNVTKQPYFIDYGIKYRQIGSLENTDRIMNNAFWVGIYPGLEKKHLDRIYMAIKNYIRNEQH